MKTLTTEQIIQQLNQKILEKKIEKEIIRASELGLSAEDNMYLAIYGNNPRAAWCYLGQTNDSFTSNDRKGNPWSAKDFNIQVMRHD